MSITYSLTTRNHVSNLAEAGVDIANYCLFKKAPPEPVPPNYDTIVGRFVRLETDMNRVEGPANQDHDSGSSSVLLAHNGSTSVSFHLQHWKRNRHPHQFLHFWRPRQFCAHSSPIPHQVKSPTSLCFKPSRPSPNAFARLQELLKSAQQFFAQPAQAKARALNPVAPKPSLLWKTATDQRRHHI